MAVQSIIECPECHKKFKGKPELEGKTVRCPGCQKNFTVRMAAGGAPPEIQPDATPHAKKPLWDDDEDNDPNPYKVTHLDLTPRCPHCAGELRSEDDIICLHCGYNLQTRQLGKTTKTIADTGGERFLWLLPGLACVLGMLIFINVDIFFCLVLPGMVKDAWTEFLDHESMRIWVVIISLFSCWALSIFAFKRLVLEPKPPEKIKD
jgi:hypothetical protein